MSKIDSKVLQHITSELADTVPQLSVNVALYRYFNTEIQVATIKFVFAPYTVIPGGFVKQQESVEAAAHRVLAQHTSQKNSILREIGVFGAADRVFKKAFEYFSEAGVLQSSIDQLSQRFVSIAYYSIIHHSELQTKPSPLFTDVHWISLKALDILALDHKEIVSKGHQKIANDILSQPILKSFLAEEFTLAELQGLYQCLLKRQIDRGNFRQRILKSNILEKVGKQYRNASGRPAELYRFHPVHYPASLGTDIKLGF